MPTFARVDYHRVRPGVDLAWYGTGDQLEYDLNLARGVDPATVVMSYRGARRLSTDAAGNLLIDLPGATLTQAAPRLYEPGAPAGQPLVGSYRILGADRVGFTVTGHDAARPLVIDPVLLYSTYLGGAGDDSGNAITVDRHGAAYLTGTAGAPATAGGVGFPVCTGPNTPTGCTGPALQTTNNGRDNVFVTKLSPNGALVYSTYLGGGGSDEGNAIAVDLHGAAWVTGVTFPPATAGGPGFPVCTAVNAPTGCIAAALQTTNQGQADAFVSKLSPDGTTLLYSSYLGGDGSDQGNGIAVDPHGAAYLTGSAGLGATAGGVGFPVCTASNMPTGCTGPALQPTKHGVHSDAFVTKLDRDGALVYSTYLGGDTSDDGRGIAVDPTTGAAWLTGRTEAPVTQGFPVCTAPGTPTGCISAGLQTTHHGGDGDGFVTKLSPNGATLLYSSYLGGGGLDTGDAIAVDPHGTVWLTGATGSPAGAGGVGFPVCTAPGTPTGCTATALQPTNNGGDTDAFVTKLSRDGALLASTYLGGDAGDEGLGIAVDPTTGAPWLTGITFSPATAGGLGFPVCTALNTPTGCTSTALQATNNGESDAFATELSPDAATLLYSTYLGGAGPDDGDGIAVDSTGAAYLIGFTAPAVASAAAGADPVGFPVCTAAGTPVGCTAAAFQPANAGGSDAFVLKFGTTTTAPPPPVNPPHHRGDHPDSCGAITNQPHCLWLDRVEFHAVAHRTAHGPVAEFTDRDDQPAHAYRAGIGWGDGRHSSGHVVREGQTRYLVLGKHRYHHHGVHRLDVRVHNRRDHDSDRARGRAFIRRHH